MITFAGQSSFEPVIGNLVLEYKTPVNILYANTRNIGGNAEGEMILQLPEMQETAAADDCRSQSRKILAWRCSIIMLDSEMIKMLVEGTRDTLYMTLFATFFRLSVRSADGHCFLW